MSTAFPSSGAVIGTDFVGTVARIHKESATEIQIGDKVCGLVHGSNPADRANGAFAQYVGVPAELVLRMPEGFPLEQAATLGTALATACAALWESGLRLTASSDHPAMEASLVLVYGGSTATGTMATQLLRLSGARPIVATCSPRNFDFVRGYGTDATLDHAGPDAPAHVRALTGGALEHTLDVIADWTQWPCLVVGKRRMRCLCT